MVVGCDLFSNGIFLQVLLPLFGHKINIDTAFHRIEPAMSSKMVSNKGRLSIFNSYLSFSSSPGFTEKRHFSPSQDGAVTKKLLAT